MKKSRKNLLLSYLIVVSTLIAAPYVYYGEGFGVGIDSEYFDNPYILGFIAHFLAASVVFFLGFLVWSLIRRIIPSKQSTDEDSKRVLSPKQKRTRWLIAYPIYLLGTVIVTSIYFEGYHPNAMWIATLLLTGVYFMVYYYWFSNMRQHLIRNVGLTKKTNKKYIAFYLGAILLMFIAKWLRVFPFQYATYAMTGEVVPIDPEQVIEVFVMITISIGLLYFGNLVAVANYNVIENPKKDAIEREAKSNRYDTDVNPTEESLSQFKR